MFDTLAYAKKLKSAGFTEEQAEICYSTLALSTDYDCWYEEEEEIYRDNTGRERFLETLTD